jgi:hypothetical protein
MGTTMQSSEKPHIGMKYGTLPTDQAKIVTPASQNHASLRSSRKRWTQQRTSGSR